MSATQKELLDWRGIEKMCEQCDGTGCRVYGSTSTWRGGVGGCAMTPGVCDVCWGSGDTARPWADLRKMRDEYAASRNRSTLDDLLKSIGGGRAEDVRGLAEVLRKIDNGAVRRSSPSFWVRHLAGWLGEELARVAGEKGEAV